MRAAVFFAVLGTFFIAIAAFNPGVPSRSDLIEEAATVLSNTASPNQGGQQITFQTASGSAIHLRCGSGKYRLCLFDAEKHPAFQIGSQVVLLHNRKQAYQVQRESKAVLSYHDFSRGRSFSFVLGGLMLLPGVALLFNRVGLLQFPVFDPRDPTQRQPKSQA